MSEEPLPDLVTKIKGDANSLIAEIAAARAAMRGFQDESDKTSKKVKKDSDDEGKAVQDFTRLLGSKLSDGENSFTSLGKAIDEQRLKVRGLQKDFQTNGSFSLLGDITKTKNDLKSLTDIGEQLGVDFGKDGFAAGQSFSADLSESLGSLGEYTTPILVGVAAAAAPLIGATIASAVSAGFGLGVIGLGAYALKDNAQIKAAFSGLGKDASSVLTDAASPLIGPLVSGMHELDDAVKTIGPDLTGMFTAAAPAASALAAGIAGFAETAAPEFEAAMKGAAPAVESLAMTLPQFGAALGGAVQIMTSTPGITQDIQEGMGSLDVVLLGTAKTIQLLGRAWQDTGGEVFYAGQELRKAADGIDAHVHAMLGETPALGGAALAAGALAGNFNQAAVATRTWAETFGLLTAAQAKNEAQTEDNGNALLAMKSADTALNTSLKKHTESWNENTTAGQAQWQQLIDATAATKAYFAQLSGGKPMSEALTASDLKATEALLKQAKQAGATKTELQPLVQEVNDLRAALDLLKNKTVIVRVNELVSGSDVGGHRAFANSGIASFANSGVEGSLPHYDLGGIYAGGPTPLYRFAEQSVGKEALIAQRGDSNRAISALSEAAQWHGGQFVPNAGSSGGGSPSGDGVTQVNIYLDSKVIATKLIPTVQRMNARAKTPIFG
jgi:hypothetical protein